MHMCIYLYIYIYTWYWFGVGVGCHVACMCVCVDVLACGLALFVGKCKFQWWDRLDRLELQ